MGEEETPSHHGDDDNNQDNSELFQPSATYRSLRRIGHGSSSLSGDINTHLRRGGKQSGHNRLYY